MSEPGSTITARQFHHADGVADWRVADGGASTHYPTDSFASGARLVAAINELPGVDEHPPDIDLRPDGVGVRLFTFAPAPDGLSEKDLEMARRISRVAADHGLVAEPSAVQNLVVIIDAMNIPIVAPFWRAVLGYVVRGGGPAAEELNDPRRRQPVICFQQMDAPRPQRNRIHIDVWVPHQEAEARVSAALAAGGRVVFDRKAPSWWILADSEGNEACVATWIGTDGLGYP